MESQGALPADAVHTRRPHEQVDCHIDMTLSNRDGPKRAGRARVLERRTAARKAKRDAGRRLPVRAALAGPGGASEPGQTASGPSVLPTAGRSDRTGRTISKRAGRSDRPGKGRSRRGQGGPTDPGGTLLIARGRSDRLRRRAGLPVADATPRRRSPPPLPYPRWSPFRTSSRRLRRRARRTARAPWSPGRARTIAGSSPRGGTPRRPAPAA